MRISCWFIDRVPVSGNITGRVINAITGEPIERAKVYAEHSSGRNSMVAVTNDHGDFLIILVQPGNNTLRAFADEFQITEVENVIVRPNSTEDVGTIELLPIPDFDAFATISGKVYFRDCETPMYGVKIYGKFYKTIAYLTDSEGNQAFPTINAATVYEDGSYQIGLIPPGDYQLRFRVQDLSKISYFGETHFDPATSYVPITITQSNAEGFKITDIPDVCLDNLPPHLISLTPSKTTVFPGETITITATAQDPDNDILYYYWSAEDGFLGLGFSNSITWTAPSTPGTYRIKVVVNDHKGGWESEVVEINVGMAWWAKTYGGSLDDVAIDIVSASDEYIVGGGTISFGIGPINVWILKINILGEILWEKAYGNPQFGMGGYYISPSDGGYLVVGEIAENGGNHLFALKIKNDGSLVWAKRIPRPSGGTLRPIGVYKAPDGGYIIANTLYFLGALWILKLNQNGGIDWQIKYEDIVPFWGGFLPTSDGGCLLAGYDPLYGTEYVRVKKVDRNFNIQWQKEYIGMPHALGNIQSVETLEGEYIIHFGAPSFLKLDRNGNPLWHKQFVYSGFEITGIGHRMKRLKNGSFLGIGGLVPSGGGIGELDLLMINFNSDGEIYFAKRYGGSNFDLLLSIYQTPDEGFLIGGTTNSFGAGNNDIWILKMLPDGTCLPLGEDVEISLSDISLPDVSDIYTSPVSTSVVPEDIDIIITETSAEVHQQAP